MEELKQWLESEKPDYFKGLNLFAKYGRNRILLQNLNRREHPAKLRYELQKIYDRMVADAEAGKKAEPKKVQMPAVILLTPDAKVEDVDPDKEIQLKVVVGKKQVNYDDLPDALKAVYDRTIENYKVMRSIHEKLKLMENASDEDRQLLVQRMIVLDEAIRDGWKQLDGWDGKTDPEAGDDGEGSPEPKEPTPPSIDAKRISANRKYISTNRSKLAYLIETNDAKAEELHAKIQVRVTELINANEGFDEEMVKALKDLNIKFD